MKVLSSRGPMFRRITGSDSVTSSLRTGRQGERAELTFPHNLYFHVADLDASARKHAECYWRDKQPTDLRPTGPSPDNPRSVATRFQIVAFASSESIAMGCLIDQLTVAAIAAATNEIKLAKGVAA